jgi:hypothetical protein
MKVICVDNFNRETRNDFLIVAKVDKETGEQMVTRLNNEADPDGPNFYRLVGDDYVLYVWEP